MGAKACAESKVCSWKCLTAPSRPHDTAPHTLIEKQTNIPSNPHLHMQPETLNVNIPINVAEIRPVHTPFRHSCKHGGTKF